jgi:hypothetical protein
MSSTTFKRHALRLLAKGILAIPLERDSAGYPKKPFTLGWTSLVRSQEVVEGLPWDRAEGLGIVLGQQSSGLCALDIDDRGLADALIELLQQGGRPPYVVRTARKRCHVYVRPTAPAPSTRTTIQWDERDVTVELKGNGTQVAAPPSPGYSTRLSGRPLEAPTLAAAWDSILSLLTHAHPSRIHVPQESEEGFSNYPTAWREHVGTEERNNTLYVEAHRLREAGVPHEQALAMMRLSIEDRYDPGDFGWEEATRTIASAYRHGVPLKKRSIFDGPVDSPF